MTKHPLTTTFLLRMTKKDKQRIAKAAKAADMEQASFCRGAIMERLGDSEPLLCACGLHWGHTSRHRPKSTC